MVFANKSVRALKFFGIALFLSVFMVAGSFATQAAIQEHGTEKHETEKKEAKPHTTKVAHTPKSNPNTLYGQVQTKLKEAGSYKGEVTGYKNAETTTAIKEYQKQNSLKVTGTLSKETKEKMGIAPAAAPAKTPKAPKEEHKKEEHSKSH